MTSNIGMITYRTIDNCYLNEHLSGKSMKEITQKKISFLHSHGIGMFIKYPMEENRERIEYYL